MSDTLPPEIMPVVPSKPGMARGPSLTEGPVRGHILKLSAFMAFGVIASLVSMLADTLFVGRLGTHELAAMSFTFPVVMLITSLAIGLGTGIVAVISRVVGEGDQAGVRALGTDSIVLAGIVTAIVSIIGFLTIDPLFRLLGAEEVVMPLIHDYMRIWYLGTLLQIIPQVSSSVMRAHGDARTPAVLMALTAIVNVVLDPIMIYGWGPVPAMGIEGAAWAGNISRLFFILAAGWVIQRGLHALAPLSLDKARLKKSWGRLVHIALPATATQLVTPLASAILTAIVASHGTQAVAAFGVATRIEIFALIYLMAISIAIAPFVGQNAGARRFDRVKEAVSFSLKFCYVGGAILTMLLAIGAEWLAGLFTKDPDVIRMAALYLYIVPISYIPGGAVAVAMSTLNSLAMPFAAATVGLSRSMLVSVPFVIIGAWLGDMRGVYIGISAAGFVVGGLSWWWLNRAVYQCKDDTGAGLPEPLKAAAE